ncbi:MAG: hypothetical protein L6Q71_04080 [Planctomycetes bacterium]|nr:hypothetical protein [Planctomycetota bacterium]NUQ33810.1 hypothetical protein [Planctomycetaceae bacterium]
MREALDLRPLDFGDILSRAFALYRSHFGVAFGLFLILAFPLSAAASLALFNVFRMDVPDPRDFNQQAYTILQGTWSFVFAFGFSGPAFAFLLSRAFMGGERSVMLGLKALSRRGAYLTFLTFFFLPYFIVLTGAQLGIAYAHDREGFGGGIVLLELLRFVLLAPMSFYVLIRFALACAIAVLEDTNARETMRRLNMLMRGARWRYFWLNVVMSLCVFVLAIPGEVGAYLLADKNWPVAGVIVKEFWWAVVVPLYTATIVVYYFDQRSRREAFDIAVLAQSFGVDPADMPPIRREPNGLIRVPPYLPEGYGPDGTQTVSLEPEGAVRT